MNCFCNLFDSDNLWWVIVLILLILFCNANNGCGVPSCGCNR